MANYGQHAECYPPGHQRGGPCGPNCPYNSAPPKPLPAMFVRRSPLPGSTAQAKGKLEMGNRIVECTPCKRGDHHKIHKARIQDTNGKWVNLEWRD